VGWGGLERVLVVMVWAVEDRQMRGTHLPAAISDLHLKLRRGNQKYIIEVSI